VIPPLPSGERLKSPLRIAEALLCALLVCAAACSRHAADEARSKRDTSSIETSSVRIAVVPLTVSAYGSISGGPNAQALLAFPEPGRIAEVNVNAGQHVAAGTLLARLDTAALEAAVAQAAANVQAANASYRKVLAGARPQQRAQTSAQIDQARTAYAVAHAQYAREQMLLRAGIVSRSQVDAARSAEVSARAQLSVLEQELSSQEHPLPQDVAAGKAEADEAAAALRAAQTALANASLRAPFSGVVAARLHNAGESVDAATPVIELANDAQVFTAQLDPDDAAKVKAGDSAVVSFTDANLEIHGRVSAIGRAQLGEGRLVPVQITLSKRDAAVEAGAYGKASIVVGHVRGLVVPSSAIVADPTTGTMIVFRKRGTQYDPVPISLVNALGDERWIKSAQLHPGDAIVVKGAAELMAPQGGAPDSG
jgi:multidrug resistance efflux pump